MDTAYAAKKITSQNYPYTIETARKLQRLTRGGH